MNHRRFRNGRSLGEPDRTGKAVPSTSMSDASLMDLLARHPITVEALAESAGVEISAVERRLAPLLAANQIAIEAHNGARMVRVIFE